ncbi:Ig-like domain-containing protein [Leptospira sp. 'Mane']|uniref:Ig-like domain-containing protein n=1 Tax=Leptospira sp. 'Mane' TaxID=3387407 RepID=UPI00398BB3D7
MKYLIYLSVSLFLVSCQAKKSETELLAQLGLSWNDKYTYPTITSVSPIRNATEVPTDAKVRILFSKPMDRLPTESSISITSNGGNTNFVPTWFFDQALDLKFIPKLTEGFGYEININKNQIKDKDGNYLQSNMISKFYTVGISNKPAVTSSNPPNTGSLIVGWPKNNDIVVNFSEPMDQATTSAAISISGGPAVTIKVWSNDSQQVTIKMLSALQDSTSYVLKVSTSAKSRQGIALISEYVVNFSTGNDVKNPNLLRVSTPTLDFPTLIPSPYLNQVTGLSKNDYFIFSFDENMSKGSTINSISFVPSIEGEFDWTSNTTLRFTPKQVLDQEGKYRLEISTVATDESNLPLTNPYIIDFIVNDTITSQAIQLGGINGRSYQAGICTINSAIDMSVPSIPDQFTAYIVSPELTCSNQYEFEILFNTSGGYPLKTYGTGDAFSKVSFSYVSGSPAPSTPIISSVDYIPSANPQRLKIRVRNITNLMRYKMTITGGENGIRDTNENYLKSDVRFLFYDN